MRGLAPMRFQHHEEIGTQNKPAAWTWKESANSLLTGACPGPWHAWSRPQRPTRTKQRARPSSASTPRPSGQGNRGRLHRCRRGKLTGSQGIQASISQALGRAQRRTAPGPDGWRYHHIQPLQADHIATQAVARLLTTAAAGQAPEPRLQHLATADLYLLTKPSGGDKPTTCASVWRSLFGRAIARPLGAQATARGSPRQAAAATPHGPELAHHRITLALCQRPHAAVMGVDRQCVRAG